MWPFFDEHFHWALLVEDDGKRRKSATEPLFWLLVDTQKSLVSLASALMQVAFWNSTEEAISPEYLLLHRPAQEGEGRWPRWCAPCGYIRRWLEGLWFGSKCDETFGTSYCVNKLKIVEENSCPMDNGHGNGSPQSYSEFGSSSITEEVPSPSCRCFHWEGWVSRGVCKLNGENTHTKACGGKRSHRAWEWFVYRDGR